LRLHGLTGEMLNGVDGYVAGDTRTRTQMYGVLRGPRGEHSQTEATASTCSKQGKRLRPATSPMRWSRRSVSSAVAKMATFKTSNGVGWFIRTSAVRRAETQAKTPALAAEKCG